MIGDRFICTKADPWTPAKGERAVHPGAVAVREESGWPSGDVVSYECPFCHKHFDVELAQ